MTSKFRINLAFACIVALLGLTGLTAAISIYKNSPPNAPSSSPEPPAGQPLQNQAVNEDAKRLAELEQLAAMNPQNFDYRTQIGNMYYDLSQYDKAIDYYRQSLGIHPRDPNVETDLATCYHYIGQDDKALEILNKVLGYSHDFSQALYNKGIVLINGKKNVKDGLSAWEELLRSDPNYPRRAELEQRIHQLQGSAQ